MKLRFAPSPTGYLHVGNARQAIANALYALHHEAVLQLRFDDTDAARTRTAEFEPAIEADLAWLGIEYTEKFRQTEHLDRYAQAAEHLKSTGRLYPCFESEEELKSKREARIRAHKPPIYDRAALRMTEAQRATAEANGKTPHWRFKLSDNPVFWIDLVGGRRDVKLSAVSDPVLIRADGTVLYTFASVVDDIETSITHIIRGEDHVTNTGVQIDLAHALGVARDHFLFGHLPLLLDDEGGKLSKRTGGAATLKQLRHDGIEPRALASYLARLGTSDDPEPLPMAELARTQDLTHVSHAQPRFDTTQLLALNRKVIAHLTYEEAKPKLPEGATEPFWLAIRQNLDLLTEAKFWHQVVAGDFMPPVLAPEDTAIIRQAVTDLPPDPWDDTTWTTWTNQLKATTGKSGKSLFRPLRLALTGEDHGPELRALLPLIGRPRTAERLTLAAA
jgi:glutamyl-tRNA synthetase